MRDMEGHRMASVRLDRLRKSFGGVVAVRDISVVFEEGKLTSVLGPSGCGKTTTLNLIAGFISPDAGSISFDDKSIADPARGIAVPCNQRNLGMVFQSYALWPHLSIAENVAYGLKMHRVPRAERDEAVRRSLTRVKLERYLDRYPHELSGGQQQRVALARAIAYLPQILLFDEPLSNLDAQLRDEMRLELKEIHQDIGVTAVYVTHDQSEAMSLSDNIIVMGDGEILQRGTPKQLYEEPADIRVAKFIGKTNMLDAVNLTTQGPTGSVKVDGLEKALRCRMPITPSSSARGTLLIRPEGIALAPLLADRDELTGRICSVTYLGNVSQYQVVLNGCDKMLEVQQTAAQTIEVGAAVTLTIDPERCYFLASRHAGGRSQ
jgi:ABC-type Fe3+/spermidine/putrescine transport system ATPase subunit